MTPGAYPTNSNEIDPKPVTNLTNGILIGVGAAALVISLAGALVLNASYASISNFLANNGVPVNGIRFTLRDIVSVLTLCVAGAVLGSFSLMLGLLNQFSRRARLAWKRKDITSRVANGLMSGGAGFASLSGGNLIRLYYEDSGFGFFGFFSSLFAILGILMIAVGVILLLWKKPR